MLEVVASEALEVFAGSTMSHGVLEVGSIAIPLANKPARIGSIAMPLANGQWTGTELAWLMLVSDSKAAAARSSQ